jgi:hypothetical protein
LVGTLGSVHLGVLVDTPERVGVKKVATVVVGGDWETRSHRGTLETGKSLERIVQRHAVNAWNISTRYMPLKNNSLLDGVPTVRVPQRSGKTVGGLTEATAGRETGKTIDKIPHGDGCALHAATLGRARVLLRRRPYLDRQ